MTDWYMLLTGRPNPGRRAPTPASRYLDDPASEPEVDRASEASARARAAAGGPLPPEWARTRGRPAIHSERPTVPVVVQSDGRIRLADVQAGARDAVGYARAGIGAAMGLPGSGYRPPQAESLDERTYVGVDDVGPILEDPRDVQVAGAVPLPVATGEDVAPFGEDFPTWYEMQRYGAPLPSYLQAEDREPAPDQGHAPRNPNNVIADAETPPVARFDATREWIEAEQRVAQRFRRGQPNAADLFFAAVFGERTSARRETVARENDDMKDEIRGNRRR